MTEKEGELQVISRPIFQEENSKFVDRVVIVLTRLFKVVFEPQGQESGADLIDNPVENQWDKFGSMANFRREDETHWQGTNPGKKL